MLGLGTAIVAIGHLADARAERREASRPMVVTELRPIHYVHGWQRLVVQNYGATVARDLSVSFDPPIPPPDPADESTSDRFFILQRYRNSIPFLPPGQALSNTWLADSGGPGNDITPREPIPNPCTVTLRYAGHDGHAYQERYDLDTTVHGFETTATSSRSPEGQAKEAVGHLKSVAESLKAMRGR